MSIKQELVADDLGRAHDLLMTITETVYNEHDEVTAIQCNDNARALVCYALAYIESAFKHPDAL